VWLGRKETATETEIHRAATIVADRLCGSVANPIIKNAQEKRQLAAIKMWLEKRGYTPTAAGMKFHRYVSRHLRVSYERPGKNWKGGVSR
jgi:type II restriction enzyme